MSLGFLSNLWDDIYEGLFLYLHPSAMQDEYQGL